MTTRNRHTVVARRCSLVALVATVPLSCAFVPLQHISRGPIMYPTSTRQFLFDFFKPEDKEGKTTIPAPDTTTESISEDPVDKIFSFFFGEKEENPMGMKRFGRGAHLCWQRSGPMYRQDVASTLVVVFLYIFYRAIP